MQKQKSRAFGPALSNVKAMRFTGPRERQEQQALLRRELLQEPRRALPRQVRRELLRRPVPLLALPQRMPRGTEERSGRRTSGRR